MENRRALPSKPSPVKRPSRIQWLNVFTTALIVKGKLLSFTRSGKRYLKKPFSFFIPLVLVNKVKFWMTRGKIISPHFQPVGPACHVAVNGGEMITPLKSDYNPSNKMMTLSVEDYFDIVFPAFHFLCDAQGEFFLFVHVGVQRLKHSSRYLRKGEQTPVAIRRLCFPSLCRIQGDFWAWVLSITGSKYHPITH